MNPLQQRSTHLSKNQLLKARQGPVTVRQFQKFPSLRFILHACSVLTQDLREFVALIHGQMLIVNRESDVYRFVHAG